VFDISELVARSISSLTSEIVVQFDEYAAVLPAERLTEGCEQRNGAVVAAHDFSDHPAGWSGAVLSQERSHGAAQATFLVVIGNGDPDVQGLGVVGVAKDTSHPDEGAWFGLGEGGECHVINAVHRVNQVAECCPAQHGWG
jgi:hypothetical protein